MMLMEKKVAAATVDSVVKLTIIMLEEIRLVKVPEILLVVGTIMAQATMNSTEEHPLLQMQIKVSHM